MATGEFTASGGIMTFRGRRVLVVGLGNSGADIVCDAVLLADASFISVRRGTT